MARDARKTLHGRCRLLFVDIAKITRLLPTIVNKINTENIHPEKKESLIMKIAED